MCFFEFATCFCCFLNCVFGVGRGANPTLGTVQACSDSHCTTCVSDYRICTACNVGAGWFLKNQACLTYSGFAAREGANTATGTVDSCTDTHCLLCANNYSVCQTCDSANGWFLKSQICITYSSFGALEGANLVAGTVNSCQDTHCLSCNPDYSVCLVCDTSNHWFLKNHQCLTYAGFAAGEGAKLSTGTVVPCTDIHCLSCAADYSICVGCDTSNSWFLKSQQCLTYSGFASREGANSATGAVVACQDTHCLSCVNNYAVCQTCDTANGWFLKSPNCLTYSGFGAREGANLVTGAVGTCQDSHCLTCTADITLCQTCDTANSWFLKNHQCLTYSGFSAGEGVKVSTGTVEPCSDSNCLSCSADYSICLGCNTANSWFLKSQSCLTYSGFSSREGVNTASGSIVPCQDANCLICKQSFSTCTACDTTSGWYLKASSCVTISSLSLGEGVNSGTGTIQPCASTRCLNCSTNSSACTACKTSQSFYLLSGSCKTTAEFTPNQGISSTDGTIKDCTATT